MFASIQESVQRRRSSVTHKRLACSSPQEPFCFLAGIITKELFIRHARTPRPRPATAPLARSQMQSLGSTFKEINDVAPTTALAPTLGRTDSGVGQGTGPILAVPLPACCGGEAFAPQGPRLTRSHGLSRPPASCTTHPARPHDYLLEPKTLSTGPLRRRAVLARAMDRLLESR